MKLNILLVMIFLLTSLLLTGCYQEAAVQDDLADIEWPDQMREKQEVVTVPEPEEETIENVSAPVVEEKQVATTGATEIKQEEQSILSEVVCDYGIDAPEEFSFRITNNEEKKWSFSSLSYDARETLDNPIVVLNALQVTNSQMQYACGRKTVNPGTSVLCSFNLEAPENVLVKKNLRVGETPLGSVKQNTLSFRTTAHAAEVKFLCE